jgi:integrase
MSVSSRRHSDGRIVYDVRLRDPLGRQYKRTFRTKKEADDFAANERVGQNVGTWVDPSGAKVTLREYATTWLKSRVSLRARTWELYEGQLRLHIFPTLGDLEIGGISNAIVRSWYASLFDKGLSQSSCAKTYRLLRTILSTAIEDGLITKNPCAIKGAGVARSPERPIATIDQVFALADAIDSPYRAAVLLGTFAGLRVGELLALTRRRIDFDAKTVEVVEQLQELAQGGYVMGPPKSDAGRRVVSLPTFMIDELRAHLSEHAESGPDGRLFNGTGGGPLRRAVLFRAWSEARSVVGLGHLHFHDLRHTGNTMAASTGASTRELMARMGHASSEAALRYQHATRERDVVIASRLDDMVSRSKPSGIGSPPVPETDSAHPLAKVTSLEEHRAARQRSTAEQMRHGCAMLDQTSTSSSEEDASHQDFYESGRRESNPRSQLGKLMFCR